MTNMSDLTAVIDESVRNISEISDEQLEAMLLSLERGIVHAMIEKALRNPIRVS
jgi:hypothetical protein